MDCASTLSIYSNPNPTTATALTPSGYLLLRRRLVFSSVPQYVSSRRRRLQFRTFSVRNDSTPSSGRSGRSRRVYRESQSAAPPLTAVPVKEIASFVLPVGSFVVVTFVMWKLVEKLMMPKQAKAPAAEKKPTEGVKWSFAAGTNLLPNFGAKIERESKVRLNDFAKELRSFSIVDMSGRNFGDEGLFYLAESLAYNQVAEDVNFAANGITAEAIKAFDGVLQSNITLKTLNLSGNNIGDEGAKILSDILAENNGIQKLQLNSTGLGDEGAKAIAGMLKKNSTLRTLELNNNLIDYSGFSGLAEALLENKSLQSLYLNGNYGGALGASALAKGLEGNKALRELFLHGNSIGDEGVRALIAGLSLHKGKLTALDIGNNMITSKGAFHVAEYIKRSKSLLWLNVYMNDIKDEGAEKIAEALKENRSITNIDLGGNDIHAKGITAIAEILKDNNVITALELGYNPIGPDGAKALADILKFHGNIKTLMIGWCKIGAKGAEFIADTLKYNNIDPKIWQESVSYFSTLLEKDDRSVRIAAGEALALIYEMGSLEKFCGSSKVISDNSVTGDISSRDVNYIHGLRAKVLNQVRDLSAEAGGKGSAKKDLNNQRNTFRDILEFLEDGYAPETSVKIGGESLTTSTWSQLIQLNFIKRYLSGGFVKHMQENGFLHEVFSFTPKKKLLSSADRVSGTDKRMYRSPNSILNKARTQFLNKQRMMSQDRNAGHYASGFGED